MNKPELELTDLQRVLKPNQIGRDFDQVGKMFKATGIDIVGAFDAVVANSPDQTIVTLDVGCGTGASIEHFWRVMGTRDNLKDRALRTIGLDQNPLPQLVPDGILQGKDIRTKFLTADAHEIPLADNSVHFGYSVALLQYCKDPLRILEEAHRVLKPNGIMLWLLSSYSDVSTLPQIDTILHNTPGLEDTFRMHYGIDEDIHYALSCTKQPDSLFEGFPYKLLFNLPHLLRFRKTDKFKKHKFYSKREE